MADEKENLIWLKKDQIPAPVQEQMDQFGLSEFGVCTENEGAIAKKGEHIFCSEMMDDLCSTMDFCAHDALDAEPDLLEFLAQSDLKKLFRKFKLIPEKEVVDPSKSNSFDRFAELAFAKAKFEVTKKTAAEFDDIKNLSAALLEEFGVGVVPPELKAVFDIQLKRRKAHEMGISFKEYLVKAALGQV